MKKILVTGAAGFIGFHLCKKLLQKKFKVYGLDNINNYYKKELKIDRIKILKNFKKRKFTFIKVDLKNNKKLEYIFKKNNFDIVIHLAAQAGIRYSLKNPRNYLENNIFGLFNLMENIRKFKIKKFIFGSSSSVYGNLYKIPFKENFETSSPLQFYGATKKAGEVFLKTYSHLYDIKTVCLRFFTVYGPWGRPDMALHSFVKKIINNETIELYNKGKLVRDFTYIDDIVSGIYLALKKNQKKNFNIYNLGNQKPVKLLYFLKLIEDNLNKKAKIKFTNFKKTEMIKTYSNNFKAKKELGYKPKTLIDLGVKKFIEWYLSYYES